MVIFTVLRTAVGGWFSTLFTAIKENPLPFIIIALALVIWYQDRQSDRLRNEVAAADLQVQTQAETIGTLQETVGEWSNSQAELIARVEDAERVGRAARDRVFDLEETFNERPDRLDNIARERPVLLERTINRGAARANRLLECASAGSPDCDADRSGEAPRETGYPQSGPD